jgi:hypothetical protein
LGYTFRNVTYGEVTAEIRRIAEEFFGVTPDGRLGGNGIPLGWPFDYKSYSTEFRRLSTLHDMGDPDQFAFALADKPQMTSAIVGLMAACVFSS